MIVVELRPLTEACLVIIRNRYKARTGNDITISEVLDGAVITTFREMYGDE